MQMGNRRETEAVQCAGKKFREKFGADPMVAACAPGRVNLIGEHTDYNDGFVFPMALPEVTVVVGSKTSTGLIRIVTTADAADEPHYVELELDVELKPGNPKWANYVKGVLAKYPAAGGKISSFDCAIATNVPLGGGLSSSASLEVAFFTFLEALFPVCTLQAIDPKQKPLLCQQAEHEYCGMPCGIMDQFIACLAQKGNALLIDCRSMEYELVALDEPEMVVLVTNSNVKHELTGSEYPARRAACEQAARILGIPSLRDATMELLLSKKSEMTDETFRRARHVITEISRTQEAVAALKRKDFVKFGLLMNASHDSLRDDFEVSCVELDELVSSARQVPGVLGSRMTGGGFGGSTVTLVEKQQVDSCIQRIKEDYKKTATFFITTPSDGARQLDISSLHI